jgi:Tfp pilus assembly pilus retraction ATPase PilT
MTPQQIALVRTSFAQLVPIADSAASLFYAHLFHRDPSLRALFRGDMAHQGRRLMEMIGWAVERLDRPDALMPALHTNDAPSAVTRLTDMGVEPFLLSSSLLGVLAQRLVRKLCTACRKPDEKGRWHPVGCAACGNTGYKGRTGIYELMVADTSVQSLIHSRAAESQLFVAAEKAGMRTMREDGERLVAEGVTSLEELLRVTRE